MKSSRISAAITKKRARRTVLFFPKGKHGLYEDFKIDSDDYLVVCEMLGIWGIRNEEKTEEVESMTSVAPDDTERRVYNLQSPTNIHIVPPSIGQLNSLITLTIYDAVKLTALPEEIGELENLKNLDLRGTGITSLPSSIGRLKNLEHLYLASCSKLSTLPAELRDLTRVVVISLENSGVNNMPVLSHQLLHPLSIYMSDTNLVNFPEKDLLLFLQRYRSIVYLGLQMEDMSRKIKEQLECNMAWWNTQFRSFGGEPGHVPSGLWPHLLANATHAFKRKVWYGYVESANFSTRMPDAIYQLLSDKRESFVRVLIDRTN